MSRRFGGDDELTKDVWRYMFGLIELVGRGISCCRLSTILPVGTAIKFPILIYLFGGLRRADIRSLVKWDRSGDLPGFILEAGIGP